MHLGGSFTFSKPLFVRIQLESFGIRISNAIIYLEKPLFYNVGLCKVIQLNFVLFNNFSIQFEWIYACFQAIFVSSTALSLGLISINSFQV